jgi:hypothetical protein
MSVFSTMIDEYEDKLELSELKVKYLEDIL